MTGVSQTEGASMFILHDRFPPEMPSDVKATFCHSFSFAVDAEQQTDRWALFVLWPHLWGTPEEVSTMTSITHRGEAKTDEMHKRRAQTTHYTPLFKS